MDNKLLNKVISISGVEKKLGKFGQMAKIKDEKGLTYTVYELKKDGTTSTAWEQLGQIQIGQSIQIGYVEEAKEFEGKGYMARTIRNFNSDIGSNQPTAQNSAPRATQSVREPSKETDWDEIAVGKCQTAFLAAYLQAGNTFADTKLKVIPARILAELVVYGTQQTEELPTINQEDDPAGDFNPMVNEPMDVSDIPF